MDAILTKVVEQLFRNSPAFRSYPEYPFQQLLLVETPVGFASYPRLWEQGNAFTQPEILFWPERGAAFTMGCDFRRMMEVYRKNMPQKTEYERQVSLLRYFVNGTIAQENLMHTDEKEKTVQFEKNPYWLQSLFILPLAHGLWSPAYPAFDMLVKTLLENEEGKKAKTSALSPKMVSDELIKAVYYLKEHSFHEALQDRELESTVIHEIFKMKARDLLFYLSAYASRNAILQCFSRALTSSGNSVQNLIEQLNQKTGIDVQPFLDALYQEKRLPQLIVKVC